MIKRYFFILPLSAVAASVAAQADFGIWADAGVEKKIDKHWAVEGEIGARSRNNSKEMDRYSLSVGTDYKLNKYVKFSAAYNLLYDHRGGTQTYHKNGTVNKITPSYWWPRHRFQVAATGSYSFGRLGFSLREMYQYSCRPLAEGKKYDTDTEEWGDIKSKSIHMLRSRLQVNYDIKNTPLTPFANAEMFHGEGGLQKVRYTVGTSLALTKHHNLKVYYRFRDIYGTNEDEQDTHVLGIGYTYKF